MLLSSLGVVIGLVFLVWSADRFIDSAVSLANCLGMSSLLIGIVIIGFGTSSPEMIVSALSAFNHTSGIALGNAYGSNITNIALILSLTAILKPVGVSSQVFKKELSLLLFVTLLSAFLIYDTEISRLDAIILLVVFLLYMGKTIYKAVKQPEENLKQMTGNEYDDNPKMSLSIAILWLILSLILLIMSSQLLVWGAVNIATYLGVSDLIIGLTIVAVGTSLPELAASIIAAKKGEVDLAMGNIIGSNLFNTLTVVGIAGVINPIQVSHEAFSRDMLVMGFITSLLFIFSYGGKNKNGEINQIKGLILFLCYIAYNAFLIYSVFH